MYTRCSRDAHAARTACCRLTPTLSLTRLIILESVAGVPGMLGGMFRHFRSLRQLERDHGE